MPAWVIDYVLVHEMSHLIEPGHDAAFWGWVDRYPQAERAKGYLLGWSAAALGACATVMTDDSSTSSRMSASPSPRGLRSTLITAR